MKKFKNVLLMSLAATTVLTTPIFAQTNSQENVIQEEESKSIQPRINFNSTVYLDCDWKQITSSNNLFPDSPLVSNPSDNPGDFQLRVFNDSGVQVGSTKTVSRGTSIRLDQIPALSGYYSVECKASVSGEYHITID